MYAIWDKKLNEYFQEPVADGEAEGFLVFINKDEAVDYAIRLGKYNKEDVEVVPVTIQREDV